MKSPLILRSMQPDDWSEVAELICVSTNYWYETHGRSAIFRGGGAATRLFCDVYEALDPGCCVVAKNEETGRLAGSCFYRERETHFALGIMNVHPNAFGQGVASRLLRYITDLADGAGKPVRLVSSALNLDSFSLYTRMGFVPRAAFQDVVITVPASGFARDVAGRDHVREARLEDVGRIAALEQRISGIQREKDYRLFIENVLGCWNAWVYESTGEITGFLASIAHPGSNMIGPGFAVSSEVALPLLATALDWNRGRTPVFLVPVDATPIVQAAYDWGGRNCELHFSQVRGDFTPYMGVVMPSFLPETG